MLKRLRSKKSTKIMRSSLVFSSLNRRTSHWKKRKKPRQLSTTSLSKLNRRKIMPKLLVWMNLNLASFKWKKKMQHSSIDQRKSSTRLNRQSTISRVKSQLWRRIREMRWPLLCRSRWLRPCARKIICSKNKCMESDDRLATDWRMNLG